MDSHWRAVRPDGFRGLYLWRRFRLALGVFIGRWDVLTWEDDPRAQWTYTPIEPSQAVTQTMQAIEDEITKRVGIPSGHVEPGKSRVVGYFETFYERDSKM